MHLFRGGTHRLKRGEGTGGTACPFKGHSGGLILVPSGDAGACRPLLAGACRHSAHMTGRNRGFLLQLAIFLPIQTILHPHNAGQPHSTIRFLFVLTAPKVWRRAFTIFKPIHFSPALLSTYFWSNLLCSMFWVRRRGHRRSITRLIVTGARHYYAAWVRSCTNFVHSAHPACSTPPWRAGWPALRGGMQCGPDGARLGCPPMPPTGAHADAAPPPCGLAGPQYPGSGTEGVWPGTCQSPGPSHEQQGPQPPAMGPCNHCTPPNPLGRPKTHPRRPTCQLLPPVRHLNCVDGAHLLCFGGQLVHAVHDRDFVWHSHY